MTPAQLAALHAQCFDTPRPWSAAEFESLLPSSFLLTTENGFLLGRVVADEAELLTIAVAPQARRKGTGRQLVDAFITESQARGATTAFLEVAADNHSALALYCGVGFAQAGRRKGYYTQSNGSKIDALVMTYAFTSL